MKVFVTGHRGYIGVHLVELLKLAGHSVTGCDLNLFDGCAWESCVLPDRELIKDVRNLTESALEGHDCVMHLAAISNDPMGDLHPAITRSINRDASVHLARLAKKTGAGRFLFSGQLLGLRPRCQARPRRIRSTQPAQRLRQVKGRIRDGDCRTGRRRLYAGLPPQRYRLWRLAHAAHRPGRQQPACGRAGVQRDPHHERRLALAPAHALPRHRPAPSSPSWKRQPTQSATRPSISGTTPRITRCATWPATSSG